MVYTQCAIVQKIIIRTNLCPGADFIIFFLTFWRNNDHLQLSDIYLLSLNFLFENGNTHKAQLVFDGSDWQARKFGLYSGARDMEMPRSLYRKSATERHLRCQYYGTGTHSRESCILCSTVSLLPVIPGVSDFPISLSDPYNRVGISVPYQISCIVVRYFRS